MTKNISRLGSFAMCDFVVVKVNMGLIGGAHGALVHGSHQCERELCLVKRAPVLHAAHSLSEFQTVYTRKR